MAARWRNWRVVATYTTAGCTVTVEKTYYAPSRYHALWRYTRANLLLSSLPGEPDTITVEVA